MTPDDTRQTTVLGTGMLGAAVARALLARGRPTTVWNRSAERTAPLAEAGATVARTARAAVEDAALVLSVVADVAAARAILDPLADALRGRVLVNLTSGTPADARAMGAWATEHDVAYLEAAAMSGTRLVGDPEALFLFAGPAEAFTAAQPTLRALGNAVYLGDDPGQAPLYDGALFGVAWAVLAAYYHGIALLPGAEERFAEVVHGHLPFVAGLVREHAGQIVADAFPDHDGTVAVHAAAMEHHLSASRAAGVPVDVPRLPLALMERAIAAGDGSAGIASVARVLRGPAAAA